MLDVYTPFETFVEFDPAFDRNDQRRALNEYLLRDDMVQGFLNGTVYPDELFACLDSQGIDPNEWVNHVVSEHDRIIDSGITYISNENGILLPRGVHA